MPDFTIKNERIDNWSSEKKVVEITTNINLYSNGRRKFTIRPWSVWWFNIGENIGTETGSHFNSSNPSYISHQRPCIVISTNDFNGTFTFNQKVIIVPLTSKKPSTVIRAFHYHLNKDKYNPCSTLNKVYYKGLDRDSLVICNEIKTIDTKRLVSPLYHRLHDEDIDEIQKFIKKYISI